MKYTKRPRPNRPPPFNPYDIMRMTAEEASPLLWVPKVIATIPGRPQQPFKYGVPVKLDDPSREFVGAEYTWLVLTWFLHKQGNYWMYTATCKVQIVGTDDTNYGSLLTGRDHDDLVCTWHKLLGFLDDCGAPEYGLNGEYLLDYCDEQLDAYERDYN